MKQTKDQAYLFNGPDYRPWRDNARLKGQLLDVFNIMKDGQKHTLPELEEKTGHPQASVSAQLRHLRKDRFGGYNVRREHDGDNKLHRYWIDYTEKEKDE